MIKGVFFDIDDTLYNSTVLARMARRNSVQAMIDAGLPIRDEEKVYRALLRVIRRLGPNHSRHYDELLKDLGVPWSPKIVAAGVVAYEHTKAGYLKPFPGVVPTLLELRKDYRLGVISNGLAIKQWEKLIWMGIHHLFDLVATSEELGSEKPGEEIFRYAVRRLGLKPAECVMVGDRLDTDILGARRCGMRTILVRRGKGPKAREADATVGAVTEVPRVLKRFSRG
ncbi:MAG: TIGR02253 family HAD-type hydrolase [Euryarchaeota archaeon]|nr:TIGR02253 family HAD-type hydrolase [Euryarchaeota archaeon]